MKKLVYFVVVITIALCSCERKVKIFQEEEVGYFKVISKTPTSLSGMSGNIVVVSEHGDTIKVFGGSPAVYLNTKIGDQKIVSRLNFNGSLAIKDKTVSRYIVGYCKIIKKSYSQGLEEFTVVTRGSDTVKIKDVSPVVFFNTSINDSVLVKIDKNIGHLKVE